MATLGALGALGSSFTWAYASTRFSQAARTASSLRVSLFRAAVVTPVYLILATIVFRGHPLAGVTVEKLAWLFASALCSYALADNLFFLSAQRLGVSSALAIASTYPLWAAVAGAVVGGERFGLVRAAGTVGCVGGVIALVLLAPHAARPDGRRTRDLGAIAMAVLTSIFWAGNTVAIKRGSDGLSVAQANTLRFAIAVVVLLALLLARRELRPRELVRAPFGAPPSGGWLRVLPAVASDGIVGSILFVYGLAHTDLAVGATLSALAPLIAVPVGIALGAERWSAPRAAAVATTVAGAVVLVLSA